jgi:DNA-binding XRE family transcriptional regulator
VVTGLDRRAQSYLAPEPSPTSPPPAGFASTCARRRMTRRTQSAPLFMVLTMVAEFSGLIRLRTREGRRSPEPKLDCVADSPTVNHRQEAHIMALLHACQDSTGELADMFGIARSTLYRAVERERARPSTSVATIVACQVGYPYPNARDEEGGTVSPWCACGTQGPHFRRGMATHDRPARPGTHHDVLSARRSWILLIEC